MFITILSLLIVLKGKIQTGDFRGKTYYKFFTDGFIVIFTLNIFITVLLIK